MYTSFRFSSPLCVLAMAPVSSRPKKYGVYDPDNIKDAIEAVVNDKMPVTKAAREYGIPRKTLADKIVGVTLKRERKTNNLDTRRGGVLNYLHSIYGYSKFSAKCETNTRICMGDSHTEWAAMPIS